MKSSDQEPSKLYLYDVSRAMSEVRRSPGYWGVISLGSFFIMSSFLVVVPTLGRALWAIWEKRGPSTLDTLALFGWLILAIYSADSLKKYPLRLRDRMSKLSFQVTEQALVFQSSERTVRVPWDAITSIQAPSRSQGSYIIKYRVDSLKTPYLLSIPGSVLDREELVTAVTARSPNASKGIVRSRRLALILAWIIVIASNAVVWAYFVVFTARYITVLRH